MKEYKPWEDISHQLREVCEGLNHIWMKRSRRFDTFKIVSLILQFTSNSNNSYLNVLRLMPGEEKSPSGSSFCEARNKMPASIIGIIRSELINRMRSMREEFEAENQRTFAVDGTKLNLPRELAAEGFYVAPSSYMPTALVTTVVNIEDRTVHAIDYSAKMCERSAATRLLDEFEKGDRMIYDCGFFSFAFLCEHTQRGIDAIFRVQAGQTFKVIEEFRKSGKTDEIVLLDPELRTYQKARKAFPETVLEPQRVRLIRYFVENKEYTLATTLIDCNLEPADFARLYWKRWTIEEFFKTLKSILKVESFHSKSSNGVEQEIHAASLNWNLSRYLESFIPEEKIEKDKKDSKSVTHYQANYKQVLVVYFDKFSDLFSGRKALVLKALRECIAYLIVTLQSVRKGRSFPRFSMRPIRKHQKDKRKRGLVCPA